MFQNAWGMPQGTRQDGQDKDKRVHDFLPHPLSQAASKLPGKARSIWVPFFYGAPPISEVTSEISTLTPPSIGLKHFVSRPVRRAGVSEASVLAGAGSDVSSLTSPSLREIFVLPLNHSEAKEIELIDEPNDIVPEASDCSGITSVSPYPEPPLTKLMVESACRIDAWWNSAHELVCIIVPLVYYVISIALAACWQPDFKGSRLYESIDLRAEFWGFPLSGWLLTMCSINISSGASQLFTTLREVMRSNSWPLQDTRLELLSRFYTCAPMLVYSVALLLASADTDEHRRRTRIAALVIWLVWTLAFTVPCSALSIFVHPKEAFLRPALLDPIMIVMVVLVLLGQAKTCGFIAGDETFLPNTVIWASIFFYLAGCMCLLNTMHRLHGLWVHGKPLPGRFYDVLAIGAFLLLSLNLWKFAGLGTSDRLVLSGTKIDFSVWMSLRMAPGTVYLTVWALRCSEILLQRAEHETKVREAALQELDKAKLNESRLQEMLKSPSLFRYYSGDNYSDV